MDSIRITRDVIYALPKPLNFLRESGMPESHPSTDIADLTDEQVKTVGLAMADALAENARRRREMRKEDTRNALEAATAISFGSGRK
jgi:hypothetical protein